MSEYLRPDVYVENKASSSMTIESVSTSVGGFVGVSQRGIVGKATYVTSWNDYILKFARGLETPFVANSYLAYAVYGFFLNGGTKCYVDRIANSATKATVKIPETTGLAFTALDEGTWANGKLKVSVVAGDVADTFDVNVMFNDVLVEPFEGVTNDTIDDLINEVSNYITVPTTDNTLAIGNGTLIGGTDGSDLLDADYLGANGLLAFDTISDVNLLAIPSQTSNAVLKGILDYCNKRGTIFPILDTPIDADTTAEVLAIKADIVGDLGAVYYPWGNVADPLSKQGKLKQVPPSGHIMGMYARTDRERGVYKSPAGTKAVVRGFVSLAVTITDGDREQLNPKGVNCIISKPNIGIVVWGARTTSNDPSKKYISDERLNILITVSTDAGTQWSVFEPNDADLWLRIKASLSAYMYNLWLDGALKGETPALAYYVKCDAELNPQETQDAGKVISEVGYATKKPGEFIIVRLTQNSMPTSN